MDAEFKFKFKIAVFTSRNKEIPSSINTRTQQLHGCFGYTGTHLLIGHVHPSDELQLVVNISATVTINTRTSQAPKTLGPSEQKSAEVSTSFYVLFCLYSLTKDL
ncbi:hypothetical protein OESDEN_02082 [Oesophagostomum dentatum]|uniref:Uncharacterized protein n=1 Tax=Oesophagostomum dentatum TaxID=61180 RepID=A0A0B1TRB3_OESDE|nr:hypothetical protein OESDEN_02082 [Oesophagostomum dentatum]